MENNTIYKVTQDERQRIDRLGRLGGINAEDYKKVFKRFLAVEPIHIIHDKIKECAQEKTKNVKANTSYKYIHPEDYEQMRTYAKIYTEYINKYRDELDEYAEITYLINHLKCDT